MRRNKSIDYYPFDGIADTSCGMITERRETGNGLKL
jgi:hypothetical protein